MFSLVFKNITSYWYRFYYLIPMIVQVSDIDRKLNSESSWYILVEFLHTVVNIWSGSKNIKLIKVVLKRLMKGFDQLQMLTIVYRPNVLLIILYRSNYLLNLVIRIYIYIYIYIYIWFIDVFLQIIKYILYFLVFKWKRLSICVGSSILATIKKL